MLSSYLSRRLAILGATTLVLLLFPISSVADGPEIVSLSDLEPIDVSSGVETFTDDYGNTITVLAVTVTFVPSETSGVGSPQRADAMSSSCTYSVTLTAPYESPYYNTAHGYVSGTVSSACSGALFIEHKLDEDQGFWKQRDFSNVYVYPGTTNSSTVKWQCNDDLSEQWRHRTTYPSAQATFATLQCNS